MDITERLKPASVVAQEITPKQKIILNLAGNDPEGFSSMNHPDLVFSEFGQIGKSVFYTLRDKGLIYLHTGGVHGGSHKAYYELSGKGKAVYNFINTTTK